MGASKGYVLGQSARAARRLQIQDAHFGEASERFLDELELHLNDRVVEVGCGPGTFSKRILGRLGSGGVLVGVDSSEGLLAQARDILIGTSSQDPKQKAGPRFETVRADIAELGSWLDGADVVVGRAVLHHVPMVEFVLGKLKAILRAGTRVGFIEPDFRSPLARLAYLITKGRPELAPLEIWAIAINQLYLANRLSPDVGASLAQTLETAGYRLRRTGYTECRSDDMMIENMLMFYDEVRERLEALKILTGEEIDRQQKLLKELSPQSLPAAWGMHRVVCEA